MTEKETCLFVLFAMALVVAYAANIRCANAERRLQHLEAIAARSNP